MFSENCALVWLSENRDLVLGEPCSGPQRTVLWLSENRALVLGETCSGSWRNVLWLSEKMLIWRCMLQKMALFLFRSYPIVSYLSYPILVQADPLIKRALDKYFKDHNQRGGGMWRMYHSGQTRFYQAHDSKVTRRLSHSKASEGEKQAYIC